MGGKKSYDEPVNEVAGALQEFLSCDNQMMHDFVSHTVCPFLLSTIETLCYAMPKDPAAFLICRTLEERKLPRQLIGGVQEWLWCARRTGPPPKGKLPIADGDVSGGCAAAVSESGESPLKPQPPEKPRSNGANPKSKLIKDADGSKATPEKEKTERKNSERSDGKKPKDEQKELNSDGEEVWDGASSSSDDSDQQADAPVRMLAATQSQANKRMSCAPANVSMRQRRFTVALGKQDLPPPPEADLMAILKSSSAFGDLAEEEQKKVAKLFKCAEFEEDDMLVNAGEKLDAIHYVVSGEAKLCVPQSMGCVEVGHWFGDDALKFNDVKSQYQVMAASGTLKTLSIKGSDFRALRLKGKKHLISKQRRAKDELKVGRAAQQIHHRASGDSEDYCALTGLKKVKEYQQTDADKRQIAKACRNNRVLGDVLHLSKEQLSCICSSVYLVEVPENEVLLRAGDKGKCLCIVQIGVLGMEIEDIIGPQILQKVSGDSFGELTIMYSTNHQATVTALQASKVWILPSREFHAIMHKNCESLLSEYSEALLKIPCISAVADKSSIDLFAGALEELSFQEGETICTEGEDDGQLFILWQGEATVRQQHEMVGKMFKGNWVGEESLIKSSPAEQTVTVTSEGAHAITISAATYNVVLKAVAALKKGKMKSIVAAGGQSVLAGELEHIDRNNYADGVMKKLMCQVQEGIMNPSSDKGGKKTKRGSLVAENIIDVGQLEQVGALGEGTFGLVVYMRHPAENKDYALKCLVKEQIKKEGLAQSVSNERSILALMDSPFVCKLHGTWQDQTFIYFLCEPVLGGELFDVYTDNDFFGEMEHARFYISCVILGLAHLHSKRVVYRDLKLENCLLGADGYTKLADMGIAKVVVGKTYTICGTTDYLAPETLKRTGHNRGADWWACGVLLFIMCSGSFPFDAPEVTDIYKGIMKGFSKVRMPDTFPSDLIDIIKSLCRKSPEERVPMQKSGVENLQDMPYFTTINWEHMERREAKPPFLPAAFDEEKLKKKKLSREIKIDREHISIWNGGLPSGVS